MTTTITTVTVDAWSYRLHQQPGTAMTIWLRVAPCLLPEVRRVRRHPVVTGCPPGSNLKGTLATHCMITAQYPPEASGTALETGVHALPFICGALIRMLTGLQAAHPRAGIPVGGNKNGVIFIPSSLKFYQNVWALRHTPQPRANSSPVGGCATCKGHSVPSSWVSLGPACRCYREGRKTLKSEPSRYK